MKPVVSCKHELFLAKLIKTCAPRLPDFLYIIYLHIWQTVLSKPASKSSQTVSEHVCGHATCQFYDYSCTKYSALDWSSAVSGTIELSMSMSNFSFVLRATGHCCFLLSANNKFYRELNELKWTVQQAKLLQLGPVCPISRNKQRERK